MNLVKSFHYEFKNLNHGKILHKIGQRWKIFMTNKLHQIYQKVLKYEHVLNTLDTKQMTGDVGSKQPTITI